MIVANRRKIQLHPYKAQDVNSIQIRDEHMKSSEKNEIKQLIQKHKHLQL